MALAHRQLLFAIHPEQALVVDRNARALHQHMNAPIAKAPPFVCNRLLAITQVGIISPY